VGRVLEDLQVVFGAAAFVTALAEPIVSDAKTRGREQVVAIGVVRERTGLAHQRIDDVPVVHRVLIATDQAWQRIDLLIGVPDLDAIGEQPSFDGFAAQSTVHRVGVAMNMDQTPRIDPATHLQTR